MWGPGETDVRIWQELNHLAGLIKKLDPHHPVMTVLAGSTPTKIKTLQKVLGSGYKVAATVGHIKDLPQKEMGVDIEKGFKPKYSTISGKQKVIKNLKAYAGDAEDIYMAPDPDREGEAISWHLYELLRERGLLKDKEVHRVVFNEITKRAIRAAFEEPGEVDTDRVNAQQARRILDRILLRGRRGGGAGDPGALETRP